MSWLDYHRILEEQNMAGAVTIERIARSATSAVTNWIFIQLRALYSSRDTDTVYTRIDWDP